MNIIPILAGLVVTTALVINPVMHYTTQERMSIDVRGGERILKRSDGVTSSKYIVYTEQETFENTDSLLAFKYDSSDIQGQLQSGAHCDVTVNGFRVPFLSMYRNILEVHSCS